MRDLIRLTRPLNLLIVAMTMMVMRYVLTGPTGFIPAPTLDEFHSRNLEAAGKYFEPFQLTFPFPLFVLLVLSTLFIMAGGNVINDYFDTRIDRVNKPQGIIVGRSVKRRVAMLGHWTFSSIGILLGLVVAWLSHHLWLALIPVFAVGALWFYSVRLKRKLLIGNGLVATLTALVPVQVGLYELLHLNDWKRATSTDPMYHVDLNYAWLNSWILGYAAFAFVSTLLRELQKDMADVRGDAANGCRTVPIAWGMQASRMLVAFWAMIIIVAVGLLADRVFTEVVSRLYLYVLVIVPILASCILTWNARTRDQHNRAGNVMKLAMVFAVGFGAVYPWLIA